MVTEQYTKGPPPAEGWWPTGPNSYRFWHGTWWSIEADKEFDAGQAGVLGLLPATLTDDEIEWRPWREAETETEEFPNSDLF